MIELKNIKKAFGKSVILENVNTVINDGEIIAIIGPSGCGKSTLLNCINVLEKPTSGKVIFNGVNITAPKIKVEDYRKKIGMVFQSYNLFGHLTVLENVVDPQITVLKRDRQEAVDKAVKCLKAVGMAEKKFSYPSSLSGGQKQRVAIARTLAMDPEVILMDEPTSALDPTMVGEVEYVIKQVAKMGRTMLIVTHSMKLAKQVATRVFYIDEKGIYEEGTVDQIFHNPQKEKTRRFIEQLKVLEIAIKSDEHDVAADIRRIQEFGERFAFDIKRINHMQTLYEEMLIVNALPYIQPGDTVKAFFEYNENDDTLKFKIYTKGDKLSLEDIDDELSRKMIENALKDIEVEQITE